MKKNMRLYKMGVFFRKFILYFILLFFALLWLIPFFFLVMGSFKSTSELFQVPFRWLPKHFDFDNYINMFQQILASPMFMFVIIIVLFWVMLIRPQRKAQKEQQARIAALQRGDKVITNAGLHGFVEKVNERTVSLKIAEGVVIELEKNAIVQVEK